MQPSVSPLDPVALYERASAHAVTVVDRVQADQLRLPTPCAEWSVQDVIDHLMGATDYLRAATGEPASKEGPTSGATADDFREAVGVCISRLRGPDVLARTCTSPLGFEWTVAEATAGTFMDTLVHTWDLAVATGQPSRLDAELVEACVAMFLPDTPEHGRAAGLVGPAVAVPDGAEPQSRLLGAMGRRDE